MFGNDIVYPKELREYADALQAERDSLAKDGHRLAAWDDEKGGLLQDALRLLKDIERKIPRIYEPDRNRCVLVLHGHFADFLRDTANNGESLPTLGRHEVGTPRYWEKLAQHRDGYFHTVDVDHVRYHLIPRNVAQ